MTIQEAEKVRALTGLDVFAFSERMGYSYATYYGARRRGKLSHGMSLAIAVRFGKYLSRVRQREEAVA